MLKHCCSAFGSLFHTTCLLYCFNKSIQNPLYISANYKMNFTTRSTVNNTSGSSEIHQLLPENFPWYTPDLWIIIFKIYLVIISIFGTFGILAVMTTKELQTIPNYYVTSLAFADLGVCSILMPTTIVTYTYTIPHWLCQIIGYLNFIIHLGLVAMNRYILICHSRDLYNWIYTVRNVCISIVGSWIFVCVAYSLPFFGFGSYGYNPFFGVCNITGIFNYPVLRFNY